LILAWQRLLFVLAARISALNFFRETLLYGERQGVSIFAPCFGRPVVDLLATPFSLGNAKFRRMEKLLNPSASCQP